MGLDLGTSREIRCLRLSLPGIDSSAVLLAPAQWTVPTVEVKPRARARRSENHVEIVDIAGYSIILAPIAEPVFTV